MKGTKTWIALALASCSGGAAEERVVDLKPVLGEPAVPPFGLDKLKRGMRQAEAQTLIPALTRHNEIEMTLDVGKAYRADVVLAEFTPLGYVSPGDVTRTVSHIRIILQAVTTPDPVIAAWGPPTSTEGKTSTWINEAAGWRASLTCSRYLCTLVHSAAATLDPAYFGAAPALPAQLSALRFGMTKDELVATGLGRGGTLPVHGASWRLVLDDRRGVSSIAVHVSGDLRPQLEAAWGAPTSKLPDRSQWLVPDTRLRVTATYEESTAVVYEAYTPIAEVIRDGEGLVFAPMVGNLDGEVQALADRLRGVRDKTGPVGKDGKYYYTHLIFMPPFEWAEHNRISFVVDEQGRIGSASLHIKLASADAGRALVDHHWPAAAPDPERGYGLLLQAEKPRITAAVSDTELRFEVEDR